MKEIGIGVIEGFFGPEWSWEARHRICENMKAVGGAYYIYAPKRDSFLRKNWTQNHPPEFWYKLIDLSKKCHQSGIAFGVGLSPFEVHDNWNENTKNILRAKIKTLEELNPDYLGIFFDDMRGAPDLAEKQLDILQFVRSCTAKRLIFCPTYYSDDPILDKVFGERPPGYLEKIATLPLDIEIFWTGSKVIPKSISAEELQHVAAILKRKPLLWENYFANDGPKQCKFLKLKPFDGRPKAAFEAAGGWAFNMMNQPALSEIVFAASANVLKKGHVPAAALEAELSHFKDVNIIKQNLSLFVEKGFDQIELETKTQIKNQLSDYELPSRDIRDWLDGKYIVGPECLTD